MIRIGQIGMAHDHAEGKMLGLRSHPEIFDVVAVAEDDPQNRERFGGKECYRGLPVLTSAEKIADVLWRESEAGHPLNLAIDCLGGEEVGECFPYVAYGCRWIMIATLAGDCTRVDMRTMYMKNIRLIGSTLRSKPPQFKAKLLAELVQHVWPKVETGEIRPTVYRVLPMTQAEEAHAILRRGQSVGKVVLTRC